MVNQLHGNEVAIIGMAGRFPGAKNVEEFWRNLRDGVESVTFFSAEQLSEAGVEYRLLDDPDYVPARAVLTDVELFDADFFGYSPREAEIIDPQQRLFLECAWEGLENAGYVGATFRGLIGVYAGLAPNSYASANLAAWPELLSQMEPLQVQVGNDPDFLTTRVSYKLNLRGPSMVTQTACSSSLVAVHLACQSLLTGECDMALAGGVSVTLPQVRGYLFRPGGILSPDGHCRPFDASAQGTIEGNGLGVVVLKRLEHALADGDTIHAVIKGSAINNDGALKVGYTAPGIHGQAAVIREALAVAGIPSETVRYVEAHGTGTRLGDPIEIAALHQAFDSRPRTAPCAVGSVKSNVGHLNAAAGIAGLIKTVLCLDRRYLLPTLHFKTPNPEIDLSGSPFYIQSKLAEWEAGSTPRRAGVSSFGMGGTNSHVVLEEAPLAPRGGSTKSWQVLLVSAKSTSALEEASADLAGALEGNSSVALADVAYTLQVGRQALRHRQVIVCQDTENAVRMLSDRPSTHLLRSVQNARNRPVAFLFPGQGSQHLRMAEDLYRTEPVFHEHIDSCSDLLRPHLGLDLRDIIYPSISATVRAEELLRDTGLAQPALFMIEWALARLWMSWGVCPEAVLGHSLGEYVAACLAGVFSLEDALRLVSARGRLMQELPSGAMAAVALPEDDVLPLLEADASLELAAVNAAAQCVVAGAGPALASLVERLVSQGIVCQKLAVSRAFHSPAMDPILARFAAEVQQVQLHPPSLRYVSNVTGLWATPDQVTAPDYWVAHLRHTVRFDAGLRTLREDLSPVLLEVGPGRALTTLATQCPPDPATSPAFHSLPAPRHEQEAASFTFRTLGQLWLAGVDIAWSDFWAGEQRRRIPLPTYPFERQRYWLDQRPIDKERRGRQEDLGTEMAKRPLEEWFYAPVWKESPLPPVDPGKVLQAQPSKWLVFMDSAEFGDHLVPRLAQEGQSVVTVRAGDSFRRQGTHDFILNPSRASDYDLLLSDVSQSGFCPDNILHLWALTSPGDLTEEDDKCLGSSQSLGFYSLLFLAKALARHFKDSPLRVWVVSNGLHAVTGEESLYPERATLLGPCKVIPQEYPHISCTSVDVIPPTSPRQTQEFLDQLCEEFVSPTAMRRVAYRGGRRWTQEFQPLPISPAFLPAPRLRQGGVYLITGGLEHVGLTLAQYLSREYQAKLVLVSRRKVPVQGDWSVLTDEERAAGGVRETIRRIQALEAAGSEVLLFRGDAANEQQMSEAIETTYARFGTLNGVIHAAGIVDDDAFRTIQESAIPDCERHFHSKVRTLRMLERLLRDRALDFHFVVSSLASVFGGLGFAAYAAANAYLDAATHAHNRGGPTPWLVVNFDGWQQFDSVRGPVFRARRDLDMLAIAPDEGQQIFARLISMCRGGQVLVSTQDLRSREGNPASIASRSPLAQVEHVQEDTYLHPRPSLATPYEQPRDELEQIIAEIWQVFLGVERVGIEDDFFDLGGHSLLATQIIARINNMFSLNVSLRVLFEARTIAQFARAIEQHYEGQEDTAV